MAPFLRFDQWPELLIFVAALALAAIQKGWRSFRMAQSQTWPLTYGRVLRSEASSKNKTYQLKVFYSYHVGQDSYQGEYKKTFPDEAEAELWADALREKQIPVHHHPEKPTRSQLWDSDLLPIVQSFPPADRAASHPAKPFPSWERLLVTAGVTIALVGCGLSLIELFGRLAGRAWINPSLSRLLAVGAWSMVVVSALESQRGGKGRAAPEWMAFVLHALMYFAILSFVFFPWSTTGTGKSRETRDLSYQILFYFSAFESFYLRLRDADELHLSRAATNSET